MVAYSFMKQFIEPIEARRKIQTIRGPRRHHARPGSPLQLFTAMRTKYCRLIGTATCIESRRLQLDIRADLVRFDGGQVLVLPPELDAFAFRDGFYDWESMRRFWREHHEGVDVFDGVVIHWGATFLPPQNAVRG